MSKIYAYKGLIEPIENNTKPKFKVSGTVYAHNLTEASSILAAYYNSEKYHVFHLELSDFIDGAICEEERSILN